MNKQTIRQDQFNDIEKMTERFLKIEKPDIEKLKSLDEVDFAALIYALHTGQYEITGISNKNFLRYFMTSGQTEDTNIPLNILNNLSYSKQDFLEEINNTTNS